MPRTGNTVGEWFALAVPKNPMPHQTILEYRHYRYLKIALLVVVVSIAAYVFQSAPVGKYGGTPVGYALGIAAAAAVVWLMWIGVRKRQYTAAKTTLQGWLSAHVYLGATLIIVTTLHAAFQVGWNIHTLAYVLLLVVIASGFFGVYAYLRLPSMQTDNLGDESLDAVLLRIGDLDKEAQRLAMTMPDKLNQAVQQSVHHTLIGGGVRNQLRFAHPDCPTNKAIPILEDQNNKKNLSNEQAQTLHALYGVMLRKQKAVARARRDVRFRAMMQAWLYVHVPLSFCLLAAMIAHIVAVFFYW